MSRTSRYTATAVALALALAACDDDGSRDASSARTGTATPAPAAQSPIPAALAGTWRATIESSRIADPPGDLTRRRSAWTLKFLGTGGTDNGPSMFLSNEQVGEIVHSIALSGDGVTLESGTDCTRFGYVDLGMERMRIRSTEEGCPATLVSSVLQRIWRLVESDPSRRGPTTAERNLAQRDEFVRCAQQYDGFGMLTGYRDGEAVPLTGARGGGELDTRVSAPRAIASMLEDGGQFVGLREGDGPDVDILFHAEDETSRRVSSLIEEERGPSAIIGAVYGQDAEGWFQTILIVSLDDDPPVPNRMTDAINTCIERATDVLE